MTNEVSKKSGKAIKWSLFTQIVSKLVSPVVNMVLARLLAPEAFGAVATINVVITFAEVFTDAGFHKYIVQHEFADDDELEKNTNVAFWTNILVSLLFIGAIVFARNPIADLVGSPGLGNAIAVASLNIILVTFSSTQTARYNRDMNFKTLFYARICTLFVPVVVTIPLAIVMRSYWALLIGTLVTNIINAAVLTVFSKWKPRLFFSWKIFREMFSFSAWILFDSIAIWLTVYIGTFIVGRYLDDYYLGLYKTSMTTVNSITNIITTSIAPVMFSQLSRCQGDEGEMKRTFYTYQRLSAIILIPLGVGMFVFKDLLTWVMLGDQWGEAIDFVGLWGLICPVVVIFNNYCSTYYRSNGKPRVSFTAQLIYLAVLIPGLVLASPQGFEALYISRSLLSLFSVFLAFLIMKFVFGFKVTETVLNVAPMIVSAVIMGAAGYLLRFVFESYVWYFVAVFICIIVYFVALFLLFPKTRKEIFELAFVKKTLDKIQKTFKRRIK